MKTETATQGDMRKSRKAFYPPGSFQPCIVHAGEMSFTYDGRRLCNFTCHSVWWKCYLPVLPCHDEDVIDNRLGAVQRLHNWKLRVCTLESRIFFFSIPLVTVLEAWRSIALAGTCIVRRYEGWWLTSQVSWIYIFKNSVWLHNDGHSKSLMVGNQQHWCHHKWYLDFARSHSLPCDRWLLWQLDNVSNWDLNFDIDLFIDFFDTYNYFAIARIHYHWKHLQIIFFFTPLI